MTRPTNIPVWATDTNYNTGPFMGQPNKIEPPAHYTENGFTPDSEYGPLAQFENWREALFCDWCAFINELTEYVVVSLGDSANVNLPLATKYPGYGGFVVDAGADTIEVPSAGVYELSIGYSTSLDNASATETLSLRVNGVNEAQWSLPEFSATVYTSASYTAKALVPISSPGSQKISFRHSATGTASVLASSVSIRRIG